MTIQANIYIYMYIRVCVCVCVCVCYEDEQCTMYVTL